MAVGAERIVILLISGDPRRWVRRFHNSGNVSTTLVCFPHAGGSASYFFRLSAALSPDVNVCAIQYPGRQDRSREPFLETIDELADHTYAALHSVTDGGAVAFLGHSMGAVVAFEVARRFEKTGHIRPTVVFVSGRRAPSRFSGEVIRLRDDADVVQQMRKLGGTDPRLLNDPEMLALVLPAFRSDVRALEQYRRCVEVRISAPIVVMTAVDDPATTVDDAKAWHGHTTADGSIYTFNGGHFFLDQHLHRITRLIGQELRGRVSDAATHPIP